MSIYSEGNNAAKKKYGGRKMQRTLYSGQSDNCCAYCKLHKCGMTVKQMRRKECLKKQCYHLEKNEEHAIWKQRETMKQKRKQRKLMLSCV